MVALAGQHHNPESPGQLDFELLLKLEIRLVNPPRQLFTLYAWLTERDEQQFPDGLAPEPRQRQNRLKPDEVTALCDEYRSGKSVRELAARYQIHRTTVLDHLNRNGVERRPNRKKLVGARLEKAARLYQKGNSLDAVGKRLDVDAATVRRSLYSIGIQIRPRRGY